MPAQALIMSSLAAGLPALGIAEPLDIYSRLPALEDVALSPDGSRLAYVRTVGDERIVAIVSLPQRQPLGALKIGSERLRRIQWADDDHLLIGTSKVYEPFITGRMSRLQDTHVAPPTPAAAGDKAGNGAPGGTGTALISVGQRVTIRRDWSLLQIYDLGTHQSTSIPDPSKVHGLTLMNVVAGEPMVRQQEGHCVVFVPGLYVNPPGAGDSYDESQVLLPALIRIDLATGAETVARQGSAGTQQWLADATGAVIAEQDYFESGIGKHERWELKLDPRHSGHLESTASGREAIDAPRLLGFGPSPDTLLVQSVENDESVWKLLSLKDGSLGPVLAEGRWLTDPIEDRQSYRMIGGVQIQDDSRYVFFDAGTQARWDALVRAFPGAHVRLVSMSEDFQRLAVRVESPEFGFKYELVDFDSHKSDPIGDVYQGLSHPLPTRRITYAAADGLQIPAYLTLPPGRDPKSLPLIVLPHSVASGVDTADFDWWSQALAAQGYAVLRANFRGSNVSRASLSAGFGQWGRKMQTDLSDGVRYLAQQGIIDGRRVCIAGAGYGGFAALAGVSLEDGIYRCAISVDGISDPGRWLHDAQDRAHQSTAEQRGWARLMGVSGPSDPALKQISPLTHAAAVRVPVLLLHSTDNIQTSFEQSQSMYEALRRAGRPVELVQLPHDDALLESSEARSMMLQKSVEFLRQHNPPD
jgi:dienelactone hydrolase